MITIDKKVQISEGNHKIEFEVEDLPAGEYDVRLVIGNNSQLSKKIDFSTWQCDYTLPKNTTFSREDIYADNGDL